MIDIFVQRGPADRRGQDIVDELMNSLPVALARGRNELDEQAQLMRQGTLETTYRDGVRPGQLLLCQDSFLGQWAGKITGVSHKFSNGVVTTSLQIKRAPRESAR